MGEQCKYCGKVIEVLHSTIECENTQYKQHITELEAEVEQLRRSCKDAFYEIQAARKSRLVGDIDSAMRILKQALEGGNDG